MAFIDNIKQWFKTGDYPTEAQFAQFFAWIRWKDELLDITDVSGLAELLNGGGASLDAIKSLFREIITLNADGSYVIALGDVITGIIIDAPGDATISIGNTNGGKEIAADINIVGGTPEAISDLIYAKAARTIYFSGINAPTQIIIIKNPL